ncbi:gleya adhesin domain-containing protein [Fusarium phyllophilum]|uniref:Gleya adhesin domain-containing protein n=1 Tax=Fusarium phyllophilum TaxID=47803 RepID=A0A8H5MRD8_9HYPO|nr:gleya adhesin domain-containing protein [Fusarium phyllophilum]
MTDSLTTLPTAEDTTRSATQPTTDTTEPTSGAITDPSTTQHPTTDGETTESTTAAPTSTSEFRYDNAYIISMLAFDLGASPFCVSYLSMTTHSITDHATTDPTNVYQVDVATITADALTYIETNYDGATSILTEFKTNTDWSEATVTSTLSIETITCFDTAYSYVAPVPTFERGSPHPEKRGLDEVDVPEAIPSDWTEAQASDICSCLDIEEPTTHTTIQTVEPTTFITTSTDAVTPIEEYTKIITTTSVSVFTSTVTEKKTSTVTAWVVETSFADNSDIAYRRFQCPFNANVYDDGFTTTYFKGKPVLSSGNAQTLQFSACSSLTIPGSGTFDASQSALLYNAYFYAKETGTYTFSVPDAIDNWGYLWVKDAAYTRNYGAWAIQGTRAGQDRILRCGRVARIRFS